jgi:hypothetical protein
MASIPNFLNRNRRLPLLSVPGTSIPAFRAIDAVRHQRKVRGLRQGSAFPIARCAGTIPMSLRKLS